MILGFIFAMLTLIFGLMTYAAIDEFKNTAGCRDWDHFKQILIFGAFTAVFLFTTLMAYDVIDDDGHTSRWEQLSDAEKDWYKRNYGEGGAGRAAADVLNSMKDK